jgi:hypothetical protein
MPGFVHMPHEALQQTVPAGHVVSPQASPAGGFSGGSEQTCWVQAIPGFVHMPHEALQQTVPAGQVVSPQASPAGGLGGWPGGFGGRPGGFGGCAGGSEQICWVQTIPGFVQIPQEGLQHSVPAPQVVVPQGSPFSSGLPIRLLLSSPMGSGDDCEHAATPKLERPRAAIEASRRLLVVRMEWPLPLRTMFLGVLPANAFHDPDKARALAHEVARVARVRSRCPCG